MTQRLVSERFKWRIRRWTRTQPFTARLSFNTLSPPKLSTAAGGTNSLKILWPDNSVNFTVVHNSDLTTTNWVTANCTITNSQGTNFATVTGVTNTLFFRLGL